VFKFDHDLVTGLIKVDIILSHYLGRHSIKMKCSPGLIMILPKGELRSTSFSPIIWVDIVIKGSVQV